jgi:hypothetical protein
MNGLLIRVGIDQNAGKWNAPMQSETKEFVYLPIPDAKAMRPNLARKYAEFAPALSRFGQRLPHHLRNSNTHLDPDFEHLSYGDQGERAKQIKQHLSSGDVIAFYAGLKPDVPPSGRGELRYALIGLFIVDEIVKVEDVPPSRWHENAHTRRVSAKGHVIVRGRRGRSGRLQCCIPIGEYRNGAYRVRRDLLREWGDLLVKDGYIHRSARLPKFKDPRRFLAWFKRQRPTLLAMNNPP